MTPHPELAAAFAAIEPDESPEARRKRFATLIAAQPRTTRRAGCSRRSWRWPPRTSRRRARRSATSPRPQPTTRSLALMAAIERGQGAPDAVVRGWLAKALGASRGPQWICGNCSHVHARLGAGLRELRRLRQPRLEGAGASRGRRPGRLGAAAADRRRRAASRSRSRPKRRRGRAGGRGCRARQRRRPRPRRRWRRLTRRRPFAHQFPVARRRAALTRSYRPSAIPAAGGTVRESSRLGSGACGMALAALRQWTAEDHRRDPSRLDPITFLPNRRQFLIDAGILAKRPVDAGAGHAGRRAGLQRDALRARPRPRRRLHPRRRQAAEPRCSGVGTSIYHVDLLSFAFRLPGNAEPGSPAMIDRVVAAFREPVMCDDVPFDTRIGIGLRGIGRVGSSPGEDLRAALAASQDSRACAAAGSWFDRKRDEAHRRAFRLLSDLKSALSADRQLELHYQPKVTLETRAPAPASRRCCAGPIRSSARSRRASSSRSPRPPRSSRR